MRRPNFDPGLTEKYGGAIKRAIDVQGQFNVRRKGATWRDAHPYHYLINTSWTKFFLIVTTAFIAANTVFALAYFAIGIDHLRGAYAATAGMRFVNAFFFSAHTLSTVGYGNIWPMGPAANTVAALEALAGVLVFAIATGLLFGRFSRPSARIGFSESCLIAPYNGGVSLQFRVVNRRTNNLIDVDARLLLMTVELCSDGTLQRRYAPLALERDQILFFPLTWTLVHPIEPASPLWGKSAEDLAAAQAEVLIMVRAFDESFGQTVHQRYSYRFDQFVWGAKFEQAFDVASDGHLHLDVSRVGDYASAVLPVANPAASPTSASDAVDPVATQTS